MRTLQKIAFGVLIAGCLSCKGPVQMPAEQTAKPPAAHAPQMRPPARQRPMKQRPLVDENAGDRTICPREIPVRHNDSEIQTGNATNLLM